MVMLGSGSDILRGGLSMTADGFWLLQDVRRWLLDSRRRLPPCIEKTVPGLAVESGSCRLIWS